MRRFIYGFDCEHPRECADALFARGIDAVVTGNIDPKSAEALAKAGLELYLCFGALGLRPEDGSSTLAQDIEGHGARWFGSGCPNDAALRARRLEAALESLRRTPTARGLFVDGARFASFASPEGSDRFFTCFCPRCMAEMRAQGIEPEAVRQSVRRLSVGQAGPEDMPRLRDWLSFRAASVRAYMRAFADAVHRVPGGKLAGGFVFAPSLAGFVGQTPDAWASLDIVSPMLYRNYPHADGPACLGHEGSAALGLCGEQALKMLDQCASEVSGLPSLLPAAHAHDLVKEGFPPDRIGLELEALRGKLGSGQRLMPILQIEDPLLAETERLAQLAGADGTGFFAYGQTGIDALPPGQPVSPPL